LYSSFDYCAPRPYFHTFEGDVSPVIHFIILVNYNINWVNIFRMQECRIGFNFANEGEAEYFLMAIKEYLRMKSEKRGVYIFMLKNNG
jgi:Wiskott-Aldrich syndrome protein